MAVEAYVPLSVAAGYRRRPIDSHGKLRSIYTKIVAAVQGDIGSTFALGTLPPGAVRLVYPMCWTKKSAGGAGLLLDIGYSAYRYKQDGAAANDGIEAGSANGLVNDLTLVAAGNLNWDATLLKFDFYSLAGVNIIGTAVGAVVPLNFTMETLITYLYE
jgi:hypothetical protein